MDISPNTTQHTVPDTTTAPVAPFTALAGLRWHDADSRALARVAYRRSTRTLYVEYRGKREDRCYAYHGVSDYRARQLRAAARSGESQGAFVARTIKPNHACERLELAVAEVAVAEVAR